MMIRILLIATTLLVSSISLANNNIYVSSRSLSPDISSRLATAGLKACAEQGYQVAVAVVDRHGNLLSFLRDPFAGHHTIDVATRKAYTAASFQSATIELQNRGMEGLRHADKILIIGGGVPIRVGGHFYGAIGISGAPAMKVTGDVDHACALAAIDSVKTDIEFAE